MADVPETQQKPGGYLRPILKRWWLIVTVVPIVTIGTYLYYDHKPKIYEASSELYLRPSAVGQVLFGGKSELATKVENYALLIETQPVAEAATQKLEAEARPSHKRSAGKSMKKAGKSKKTGGRPKTKAGKSKKAGRKPKRSAGKSNGGASKAPVKIPAGTVGAQGIEKSSFIIVTGISDTPAGAARLANAYSTAFIELQQNQLRHEAGKAAKASEAQLKTVGHSETSLRRRETLEQQVEQLRLVAAQPTVSSGLTQVQEAVPVPVPVEHDPTKNAIFAFVISLMLAIGGAYGLEQLSRRMGGIADIEAAFDLPVLAEIPQVRRPSPRADDGVEMAPAFRLPFQRLQTNLEVIGRGQGLRTILVASAVPGEGKSLVAVNLGLAYREAGRRVALLDADFRRPSLDRLLAGDEGLGLSDLLAGEASFGQVVQEVPALRNGSGNGAVTVASRAGGGELAMIPAGGRHAGLVAGLASAEMRDALATAADAYGVAIIDSPPLLGTADALPLLREVDAVVLVTRVGVTTREAAQRLRVELERLQGVKVAGIVVNGIPRRVFKARSYGYGQS